MANDKESRQQSSERAQTSSGSAQQGEYQPSSRGSMSPQGGYSQQPQTQSTSREMTERGEVGQQPAFGPFSMMRRLTDDIDRMFESFGMGRSFFPTDFWQGGR